jgi:hypothetical protein
MADRSHRRRKRPSSQDFKRIKVNEGDRQDKRSLIAPFFLFIGKGTLCEMVLEYILKLN